MSRFRHLTASLVIAGGLGLLCPAVAYAAEATLTSPAGSSSLTSKDAIVVQVADSVSDDRYANFFLLFDGDDITSLVAVNGRTVTYQPPVKPGLGDHILVLTEKTGDNQFTELARWSIHVGGGGLKDATVSGDLSGQYNYLLADNLEGRDRIEPHSGTAVLNVTGDVSSGNWDTNGKMNGFFDSKATNNGPDNDHFKLGEYLMTSQYKGEDVQAAFNLGNHDPGISNLLIDQYYRRGLSTRFDIDNWLRLTAFAQDPARAIGNGNISGAAREDQRAEGGAVRFYPFKNSYGERVFVEGAGYYGEGTVAGDGAGVAVNPNNIGSGWAAAVEGQTLTDKVNARADVAGTKFDDDGHGTVVTPAVDHGYRARLAWSPIATLVPTDAATQKMQFIALYQRFGTYFRSLANLNTPIDEQRLSLTNNYLKDSLSTTLEGHVVQNNVDDIEALPTDRSAGGLAQVSVQPVFFKNDIAPDSILGRSTLTAGASVSREYRHETPAAFLGTGLDQSTITANGGWTVAFEKASASLTHTYTSFDDNVLTANSYHTNFTQLSMTWTPSERFSLTPSASAQFDSKQVFGMDDQQFFAGFDAATVIIPDKLTNTFHYSMLLDDDTGAGDRHDLATEFVYQLKQAAVNNPGYAVGLGANYNHGKRDLTTTDSTQEENYRVFLSLKVSAPFALN